jgi:MazG family protein
MNDLTALLDVIRRLRAESGCAWDRAQTPESLLRYLHGEVAELADALASADDAAACDELGDVLFVALSLGEAAADAGRFPTDGPARAATEKMIRRHPGVFAGEPAAPDWETLKRAERPPAASALDGVPRSLEPLARATELTRAAARVGFDWPDAEGARAKLDEEISELDEARAIGDRAHVEAELGDLLLTVVNLARLLDLRPDAALRGATTRFERRFRAVEQLALAEGADVSTSTPDVLDAWWRRAKELTR